MSLPFAFFIIGHSIFVDSCFVHWIEPEESGGESFRLVNRWLCFVGDCVVLRLCVPSLVKVNEEHNVVSETGQSVGRWHGDDEGEHVVDEGIECLATINELIAQMKQQPCNESDIDFIQHGLSGVVWSHLVHKGFPGQVGHRFQLLN